MIYNLLIRRSLNKSKEEVLVLKRRKIALVVGSDSDFTQCIDAAKYLEKLEKNDLIKIISPEDSGKVIVASIHRHKKYWLDELLPFLIKEEVNVIVCGAGWAAHLPGMIDSHLRYDLRDDKIVIVGVAFADNTNIQHTNAAILSISDVPGTQVIFNKREHVGPEGMLKACQLAAEGELPKIVLPDPTKKPYGTYSWEEVFQIARKKTKK